MATINENINQLVKTEAELREIISLCYAPVADNEGLTSYPDKLARLAVDEPTPEVIGVAPRVTAGGRVISDSISSVRKVYGETIVWNQSSDWSKRGIKPLSNSFQLFRLIPILPSRKYLFVCIAVSYNSNGNNKRLKYYSEDGSVVGNLYWSNDNETQTLSKFFTPSSETTYMIEIWTNESYGFISGVTTYDAIGLHFDLTKMFGSGKEPNTIDDFTQRIFGVNSGELTYEDWENIASQSEPILVNSSPKSIVSKPKTVWLNQILDNTYYNTNGYNVIQEGERSHKFVSEAGLFRRVYKNASLLAGTKYLFLVDTKIDFTPSLRIVFRTDNSDDGLYTITPTNNWSKTSIFFTPLVDSSRPMIGCHTSEAVIGSAGDSMSIRNFCCIDLTRMFGASNEPSTLDEFTQRIFHKDADDVTDAEWDKLAPYCEGEERVERGLGEAWESTLEIDPKTILDENGEQVFPEGLLSAGKVCDDIDWERGVAIKRVANADLGSLDWTRGSYVFFTRTIKPISTNLICNKHEVSSTSSSLSMPEQSVAADVSNNRFFFKKSDLQTNDEIKDFLAGSYIHYEISPIEYPLPSSWRKSWMRVANGGTERITADGMTLPLHADIAYRTANAVALANDLSNANNLL